MRKKLSIYRVTMFLVLSSLFVITSIVNTALASPILDTESDVSRNESAAPPAAGPDVVILAKETGLPLKSVERAIAFQQAFAKYAVELMIRYPNQISVVWTEPVPNTRGHVQFVGEVPPQEVAPQNVVLTGGGLISMADHKRRAELAAKALVDLEHRNGLTFFDPILKVIRVELKLPEAAPQPSKPALVDAVQRRVRSDPALKGRAAVVGAADLELTVIRGDGPIVTNQHLANARGGN